MQVRVVFCLLLVAFVICDVDILEHVCSRSDFELKMTEGLEKLEQNFALLEDKRKELHGIVEGQREEIQRLKKKGISSAIVEIKLPTNQTFAAGDTIIFTQPVVNTGNAYNTAFGFFEPPVNGIYSFSATICTYPDTWMVTGLMKDNDVIDEIIIGDQDWHQCATNTAVIYVTSSDKIWVKVLRTNHGFVNSALGISSFTGMLLNKLSP